VLLLRPDCRCAMTPSWRGAREPLGKSIEGWLTPSTLAALPARRPGGVRDGSFSTVSDDRRGTLGHGPRPMRYRRSRPTLPVAASLVFGSCTTSLIWPSSNALSCPSTVLLMR
jgi:hypothetical protein